MVSGSEGDEDGIQEGSGLELVLEAWAQKEYANALCSGDPKKYFADSVKDVAGDFAVPHIVYHNILDFVADRSWYHVKHHVDPKDLKREVLCDAFQYLLELKNDFGMVRSNQPLYHKRWR